MTPLQVVDHFLTQQAAADALSKAGWPVQQSAVANWIARGRVPDLQQLRLEQITEGKLKADRKILQASNR